MKKKVFEMKQSFKVKLLKFIIGNKTVIFNAKINGENAKVGCTFGTIIYGCDVTGVIFHVNVEDDYDGYI